MDSLFKATIPSKCNNFFNLINFTIPTLCDWLSKFFNEYLDFKGKIITSFDNLIELYTKDYTMMQSLKNHKISVEYIEGSSNIRFNFERSNVSIYIRKVDDNYEVYANIDNFMDADKLKSICKYLENTKYFQQAFYEMFYKQPMTDFEHEMFRKQPMSDSEKDESGEYKYIPSVVISKTYTGFVSLYKELRNLDKSYFNAFVKFIEEYDFDSIKDFIKCAKNNKGGNHFDIVDYSSVVEEKVYIDFKSKTDSGIHNYRVYIEEDTDKNKLIIVKIISGMLHKDFNNLKWYFANYWNIEQSFEYMNDEED